MPNRKHLKERIIRPVADIIGKAMLATLGVKCWAFEKWTRR
jgi:hypothetical protein